MLKLIGSEQFCPLSHNLKLLIVVLESIELGPGDPLPDLEPQPVIVKNKHNPVKILRFNLIRIENP